MIAAYVKYFATPFGYSVTTYTADGRPVDEYTAGNSRKCSQTYLAPGTDGAVPEKQLRTWAEATAFETAENNGLSRDKVSYDEDGEADARAEGAESCGIDA
jgi:hypothetical protein